MKSKEKEIKDAVNHYVDKNLTSVIDWHMLDENQINHIKDVASSIILSRENIKKGASFVQAILNNNLEEALSRADSTSLRALHLFVFAKNFIQL